MAPLLHARVVHLQQILAVARARGGVGTAPKLFFSAQGSGSRAQISGSRDFFASDCRMLSILGPGFALFGWTRLRLHEDSAGSVGLDGVGGCPKKRLGCSCS